jgi:GST-like protein
VRIRDDNFILFGVRGWGSAIVEAQLTWCGCPYEFRSVEGFDAPGPVRERLLTLNPLGQVPVLLLRSGEVMTETAAIALWLDETFPKAVLCPRAGSPARAPFLRLLVWLVTNVYPTFTYGDYPARWTPTGADELRESTDRHREQLWRSLQGMIGSDGPHVLGETFSALDIYLGAMVNWRPGRDWFRAECSILSAMADAAIAHPQLRGIFALNFPEAPS